MFEIRFNSILREKIARLYIMKYVPNTIKYTIQFPKILLLSVQKFEWKKENILWIQLEENVYFYQP